MATVRMSMRLVDEIESAAKTKFNNTHDFKEQTVEIGDVAFDTHIKPNLSKFISTTKECFQDTINISMKEINSIQLHSSVHDDDDDRAYNKSFEIPLSTPYTVPKFMCASYYSDSLDIHVTPTDPSFIKALQIDIHNNNLALKRRQFTKKITDTLNSFTTLNQALKAFPSLSDLVKPEYIQKVNEKVNRTQKAKEQKEFAQDQLSELNEVLLTDKLLGDD